MTDKPKVVLTDEEAVALLEAAVEKKGADYTYQQVPYTYDWTDNDGVTHTETTKGCVYFECDGTPSCIVGHVLADKGITGESLEALGLNSEAGISDLFQQGIVEASSFVEDLLMRAQSKQDSGTPWGEAVDTAKQYAAEKEVEREEFAKAVKA